MDLKEPAYSLSKPKSALQKMKESIRKLPVFEVYDEMADTEYLDFEWPQKAQIKLITEPKQFQLKEIRYTKDAMGLLTGIKFVSNYIKSPFFSAVKDSKNPPLVLPAHTFYSQDDGRYLLTNVAARIETNQLISNVYFNNGKSSIHRMGIKRGNGELIKVDLNEGEEIIGLYGCYNKNRTNISALGFIAWKPVV